MENIEPTFASFMQSLNCFPLPESKLPQGIEVENPASDYHPALNLAYPNTRGLAWIVPFVLKRQQDYLVPLWIPVFFDAGRFRVDEKHFTPWIPSVLCAVNSSVSPWLQARDQFAQLLDMLKQDWSENHPSWGGYFQRCLMLLEEGAKTPWHHFFQRHNWQQCPSRIFFQEELDANFPPYLLISKKDEKLNISINENELSAISNFVPCGAVKEVLLQNEDVKHLNYFAAMKENYHYALHALPSQSKAFLINSIASMLVQKLQRSEDLSKSIIAIYSPYCIPNFQLKYNLRPKVFEENCRVYLEGLHLLAQQNSCEDLFQIKEKIEKYQQQDCEIEARISKWQVVLKKCDQVFPKKWTEKFQFVHQKRLKARNQLLKELVSEDEDNAECIEYHLIPSKISELKVCRHKIHKKIMLLAQKQCQIESELKKFQNWCIKNELAFSQQNQKDRSAALAAIYWKMAPLLLEINYTDQVSVEKSETGLYEFYVRGDELKCEPVKMPSATCCIFLEAHRYHFDEILKPPFSKACIIGDYFSQSLILPVIDFELPFSAIQHSLSDLEELPKKLGYERLPKLATNTFKHLSFQELALNYLLRIDTKINSSNIEIEYILHSGMSNIKNLHFSNLEEIEVVKHAVEMNLKKDNTNLAVVTLFYEQKELLNKVLDCDAYCFDEMPDSLFDVLIVSIVYTMQDQELVLTEQYTNAFYKILSHVKNRLILVGNKNNFIANKTTVLGRLVGLLQSNSINTSLAHQEVQHDQMS